MNRFSNQKGPLYRKWVTTCGQYCPQVTNVFVVLWRFYVPLTGSYSSFWPSLQFLFREELYWTEGHGNARAPVLRVLRMILFALSYLRQSLEIKNQKFVSACMGFWSSTKANNFANSYQGELLHYLARGEQEPALVAARAKQRVERVRRNIMVAFLSLGGG